MANMKGRLGASQQHRNLATGHQNKISGARYNTKRLSEEQKEQVKKAVRQVKRKQNLIIINPEKPEPTGY